MQFNPSRLKAVREKMGINKAEAARMLNMTAMGYGRYENGQREPSFQTLSYIALTFGTSVDYLCDESDISTLDIITINKNSDPALFELVNELQKDNDYTKRILSYYYKLTQKKD